MIIISVPRGPLWTTGGELYISALEIPDRAEIALAASRRGSMRLERDRSKANQPAGSPPFICSPSPNREIKLIPRRRDSAGRSIIRSAIGVRVRSGIALCIQNF